MAHFSHSSSLGLAAAALSMSNQRIVPKKYRLSMMQKRTENSTFESSTDRGKRTYKKLSDDMTALLENTIDSDVEIVVKGHKFSAHKVILKARSSVFAAMFTHQMEENQQNKVVINDIEREVFSKVLRYIYTDSVVNEDINTNMQLFSAADKYNLETLKSICEEYIGSQLTVKSVSDVLILADNHSAQELKVKAIDFIRKNAIQVMTCLEWSKVMDRPELLKLIKNDNFPSNLPIPTCI